MELKIVDISKIRMNPRQPRKSFDAESIKELAESIQAGDLLQPPVVHELGNGFYENIAGERRIKAFEYLKEKNIPVIVRKIEDAIDGLEKSLVENLQRDDLTSVERENAIGELWESGRYKTHRELGKKLGISGQYIGETLAAINLRKKIKISDSVSTRTISDTMGMSDKPRKTLLKKVEKGIIEPSKVRDVARKIKEFPNDEQQVEEIERISKRKQDYEELDSYEVDNDLKIATGEKPVPEEVDYTEVESDNRMLESYKDILSDIYGIDVLHINNFKNNDVKLEAVGILWKIYNHVSKQLFELGEIQVLTHAEKKDSS